jgi:hypothetical protein
MTPTEMELFEALQAQIDDLTRRVERLESGAQ